MAHLPIIQTPTATQDVSELRHKRIFSVTIFSAILSEVTCFDPTDASLVSIERILDAVQKIM